jgi:hypothetical protein
MDPYLEHYELWESVHSFLIGALAAELGPRIRPRYRVSIEQRFYVLDAQEQVQAGVADALVSRTAVRTAAPNGRDGARHGAQAQLGGAGEADGVAVRTVELPALSEVRQRYLEIRRVGTNEVVTVIEVLSPVNKRAGEGRRQYEAKRLTVANSFASLVEIDLLRDYQPLPVYEDGEPAAGESLGDYRVLVSRGAERPRADLYTIAVRDPLPAIPIPLLPGDEEPRVNLKAIVDRAYDLGSYDLVIDYRAEPVPPLRPEDVAWADSLLREKGLR